MSKVKKYMKFNRIMILFWTAFIGIGAVAGSMMFFLDPQGGFVMQEILPVMQSRLPFGKNLFSNFIFSGISLLMVNGISNLVAFTLIIKNKKSGYILGFCFGITLMLWIAIQFYVFAPNVYVIDIAFFSFGLCQFINGYLAYVSYCQSSFKFNLEDYPQVGQKSSKMVIYFSRMGYTKKLAYQKANELACEIVELKTIDDISGVKGFWWCGRFAMHRWGMKLEPLTIDLSQYDTIYIYGAVWAFKICAPIRQFLEEYLETIPKVEFHIVHFMRGPLKGVSKELKTMLDDKLLRCYEHSSHFGKYFEITNKNEN